MYEIVGLEEFGIWCKKGEYRIVSDATAERGAKKGYLKILKYLGKNSTSPYFLKKKIEVLDIRIRELLTQKKILEEMLEKA
jgi:hypothetical protein